MIMIELLHYYSVIFAPRPEIRYSYCRVCLKLGRMHAPARPPPNLGWRIYQSSFWRRLRQQNNRSSIRPVRSLENSPKSLRMANTPVFAGTTRISSFQDPVRVPNLNCQSNNSKVLRVMHYWDKSPALPTRMSVVHFHWLLFWDPTSEFHQHNLY